MTTPADAPSKSGPLLHPSGPGPLLDAELERELLVRAQAGDQRATERLVVAHMRMVRRLARAYQHAGVSRDDLFSEGMVGLLEAVRRFDLERSNRFSTYAGWWIKARLGRYVTETRHLVPLPSTRNARRIRRMMDRTSRALTQKLGRPATREELALALDVSPEEVAMVESAASAREVTLGPSELGLKREIADESPTPEQLVMELERVRMQQEQVEAALCLLSERERRVLTRRILEDERESLAQLGEHLGISRERVRQIQVQAESKLRGTLREVAA
jgi:RNA polymerase sigma-32 factor